MYSARPRVRSVVWPAWLENGRSRMLSNQYCPFVVGPASLIAFIMLFGGAYDTGSGRTGFARPPNVGVPGSTAGGIPGTYSAYASAPPPSSTVADAATAARRRRATHLLALTPILDPSLLGAVSLRAARC